MTVRLLRAAHREVVRPVLKAKHDVLRSALSVLPNGRRTRRGTGSAPADDPSAPTRVEAIPTETPTPSPSRPTPTPTKASSRTKAELYEEATRRDIAGRSTMTKAQLLKALDSA